mmetsp:Transcript_11508/g.28670  ORF Transcript_11508/g.28670 Transcript_11508/m.28670 type:complete len:149 (-) Transcript_11508:1095-1541(-)
MQLEAKQPSVGSKPSVDDSAKRGRVNVASRKNRDDLLALQFAMQRPSWEQRGYSYGSCTLQYCPLHLHKTQNCLGNKFLLYLHDAVDVSRGNLEALVHCMVRVREHQDGSSHEWQVCDVLIRHKSHKQSQRANTFCPILGTLSPSATV